MSACIFVYFVSVFDELFEMFRRQTSSLKRSSVNVSDNVKRPRYMIAELGNCHLVDLLGDNSPQQPQSTTSLDSTTPDSSTSVDTNPLLKQLLMDNETNDTPANEAEPAQKNTSKNLLLKVFHDSC